MEMFIYAMTFGIAFAFGLVLWDFIKFIVRRIGKFIRRLLRYKSFSMRDRVRQLENVNDNYDDNLTQVWKEFKRISELLELRQPLIIEHIRIEHDGSFILYNAPEQFLQNVTDINQPWLPKTLSLNEVITYVEGLGFRGVIRVEVFRSKPGYKEQITVRHPINYYSRKPQPSNERNNKTSRKSR